MMKSNKHFSIWNNEEVKQWLVSIKMERYIESFSINNVHGYDLCYLTSEDFKTLGIVNIHDKNTLLKGIRLKTLEQLQIQVKYEAKEALIQLDFDSSFTVYNFTTFLNELFNIQSPITIATGSNEILCPNIKLVELILLNPLKYKSIKVLKNPNEPFIYPSTSSPPQYQSQTLPLAQGYTSRNDETYQRVDYDTAPRKNDNHMIYTRENNRERVINDEVSDYDSEENYENNIQYNGRSQVIPIDEQDEETDRNHIITNRQLSDDSNIMNSKLNHYNDTKAFWNNANSASATTSALNNYNNNSKHNQRSINNEHQNHSKSMIENKKYNSVYDTKPNQGFNYDYKQPTQYSNAHTICSINNNHNHNQDQKRI